MMTMTICSKIKSEYIAYATVCGDHHKKERKPNQDAVIVVEKPQYTVLSVADGVGSQKFSRRGSRAIVKAVASTFRDFVGGTVEKKNITSTVFARYKNSLKNKYKSAASTTCLFVVLTAAHGAFVGQAGDGLCLLRINGRSVYVGGKEEDFMNDVQAISATRDGAKWRTKHYDIVAGDKIEIMLATDGISGDVIPGKEGGCMEYFLKSSEAGTAFSANRKLKACLKEWGKTGSNDDKTVIVYKGEAQVG